MRAILPALLAALLAAPAAAGPWSPEREAKARSNYLLHCGGCHLRDGRGAPPEVPDLRTDPIRIVQHAEGRAYLVRVPGPAMAPFSAAELADVMNWTLQTFSRQPIPFEPFSAEEVARYRQAPLMDPLRVRARIWAELDY